MEKLATFLFTTGFCILLIALFYLKPPFLRNISSYDYRPYVITMMAILSFILLFIIEGRPNFHIINENKTSFLFFLATWVLFLGPQVQNVFYIHNHHTKNGIPYDLLLKSMIADLTSFYTFRSCFVAPITEEMIYRAFTCTLWESAGFTWCQVIFLSPFIFGLSHFHKYFLGSGPSRDRLLGSLGQCGFTTLFGWWEAFIWLKTHNFFLIFSIHAFCNYLGFPDFQKALKWRFPTQKLIISVSYFVGIALYIALTGYLATSN